jgi:hypothetical protein
MKRAITIVGILGILALIAVALLVVSQWLVPQTVSYSYAYSKALPTPESVTAQAQTFAPPSAAGRKIEFDPAYPAVEVLGEHQFSVEPCARLEIMVKSPHARAVSLIDATGKQVPLDMGYCDGSTCYFFSVPRPVAGIWQLYSPTLCEAQFICRKYDVIFKTPTESQHLLEDKPIEIAVSVVDAEGAVAKDALVTVFVEDPNRNLTRKDLALDRSGPFRTIYDHDGTLGRYILNAIARVDDAVEERERAVYVVSHPHLSVSANPEQALEAGSLEVTAYAYVVSSSKGDSLGLRGGKWIDDSESSTEDSVKIIAALYSKEDRQVRGPITLHDDGETPDDSRSDGWYSGSFPDVREGQYTLAVTLTVNTSSFTASDASLQDITVPFKCFPIAEVKGPPKLKAGESAILEVTLYLSRTNPGFSPALSLLSSRDYIADIGVQPGNFEVTSAEPGALNSREISVDKPAKWAWVISPKESRLGKQQMMFYIFISDEYGDGLMDASYLSTQIEVTNPLGFPAEIIYVMGTAGTVISVPFLTWLLNEWSKRQEEKRKVAREEAKRQREARSEQKRNSSDHSENHLRKDQE